MTQDLNPDEAEERNFLVDSKIKTTITEEDGLS